MKSGLQNRFQQGAHVNFVRIHPHKNVRNENKNKNEITTKESTTCTSPQSPSTVRIPPNPNIDEGEDEESNETILFCSTSFQMTLLVPSSSSSSSSSSPSLEEEDDHEEEQNENHLHHSIQTCQNIQGEIIITTHRILFAVQSSSSCSEPLDTSIHASLIGIFALSDNSSESEDPYNDADNDPDNHPEEDDHIIFEEEGILGQRIYVQLNIPCGGTGNDGDDSIPMEVYFSPSPSHVTNQEEGPLATATTTGTTTTDDDDDDDEDDETKTLLQQLFDALCQQAELNPLDGDMDDDYDNDDYEDGYFGLDTGEGFFMRSDEEDMDDDYDSKRKELLEKLDNMLIVPPDLDKDSNEGGQFDDAENDDDLL